MMIWDNLYSAVIKNQVCFLVSFYMVNGLEDVVTTVIITYKITKSSSHISCGQNQMLIRQYLDSASFSSLSLVSSVSVCASM